MSICIRSKDYLVVIELIGKKSLDCLAKGHISQGNASLSEKVIGSSLIVLIALYGKWPNMQCHNFLVATTVWIETFSLIFEISEQTWLKELWLKVLEEIDLGHSTWLWTVDLTFEWILETGVDTRLFFKGTENADCRM